MLAKFVGDVIQNSIVWRNHPLFGSTYSFNEKLWCGHVGKFVSLAKHSHIILDVFIALFKNTNWPIEVVGLLCQMFWVSRVETISSWRVMINYIWGSQRFDHIPFFVVNHLSHGSILALEDVIISFFLSIDEETS